MKSNKKMVFGMLILFMIITSIFSVSLILAEGSTTTSFNVCCEKTKSGAWCQNTLEENCDTSIDPAKNSPFRKSPTSCDSTSFCKMGCCIDSFEGLCMENTPQRVCEQSTGTWLDDANCNVRQCNLGCCVLGNQASFVTLTRCKRLSAVYGLETNFKNNVNDESTCILMTQSQDRGACVYELENQKTCKFTTRSECTNLKVGGNVTSKPEFFKDYLCSADELGTNCGPTTKTICIPGKDEVYFVDSCGNQANIYDSGKTYDKMPSYWKKVVAKSESCGFKAEKGNAGSKTCGNCDYFSGSICSAANKNSVAIGENMCKDLNCYKTENGNNYKNGESWCIYQGNVGSGSDSVGSRHARHICINGEETIEPCGDFRTEVCVQNPISTTSGDFMEAACRINRWQDCIDQDTERKCTNIDQRDCFWYTGAHFIKATTDQAATTQTTQTFNTGSIGSASAIATVNNVAVGNKACLPNDPPGLKFWTKGDAQSVCSNGNAKCIVKYEKDAFGKKKCVENCDCLTEQWVQKMNRVCSSLGDCGAYVNYAGAYTQDGLEWKVNGKRKDIQTGFLSEVKNRAGA